jgi:hypothetical protein
VQVYVVSPRGERPVEIPDDLAVVLDPTRALEAAYGAQTECLYLIRPDLYVGFRSQPASGDALDAYLTRIGFTHRGSA